MRPAGTGPDLEHVAPFPWRGKECDDVVRSKQPFRVDERRRYCHDVIVVEVPGDRRRAWKTSQKVPLAGSHRAAQPGGLDLLTLCLPVRRCA